MNPIIKIINKTLIGINRLLDNLERQTVDMIKKSFYFIAFLSAVIAAFFGMMRGKESAQINRPPLAEYTNELFHIHMMREKKGGSFEQILDTEMMHEFKQTDPGKQFVPNEQNLSQSLDDNLVEPSKDVKQKQVPSIFFEDKLIEEVKPKNEKKDDVRPLQRSELVHDNDLVSHNDGGKQKLKKGRETSMQRIFADKEMTKKTQTTYTHDLPLNIIKYADNNNFFLTFDVGSDNEHIDFILQTLRTHNVKATFFVTGRFIKSFPADVRNIVKDGHIVGNHTLTHSLHYTRDKLIYELKETENLFEKITGKKMYKIWRAPYLQHIGNKMILKAARDAGYQHIDASLVIMDDWIKDPSTALSNNDFLRIFKNKLNFKNNKRIYINGRNHTLFKPKETSYQGVIMLMHTGRYRKGNKDFVYCLNDVISHLKNHGYYFDNCSRFTNTRF